MYRRLGHFQLFCSYNQYCSEQPCVYVLFHRGRVSSGYFPRRGIAESTGVSIFWFY